MGYMVYVGLLLLLSQLDWRHEFVAVRENTTYSLEDSTS